MSFLLRRNAKINLLLKYRYFTLLDGKEKGEENHPHIKEGYYGKHRTN